MLKSEWSAGTLAKGCMAVILSVATALCLCSSQHKRAPRFGDMYDCFVIVDAEVSPYSIYRTPERPDLTTEVVEVEEEYEQVDYEVLLDILKHGRYVHAGFLPAWRVQLYDGDGIRYRLYVSKSCRFFRIDGNYFRLSRKNAGKLKRLFGDGDSR